MALTIQQVLSILFLFVGIVGAHVHGDEFNPEIESVSVINVTSKTAAIERALEAFGINDTKIRIGQILCPPSNLSSEHKRNIITVGLAGCYVDPLIAQYTQSQRRALEEQHSGFLNCSATTNLAGYLPPVAEYIISLWIRGQQINNDPTLLPNHLLCLKLSLSSNITMVLSSIFNDILHNDIPTIIDVSPTSWNTVIKGFVLPHRLPTVRYSTGSNMDFATVEDLVRQLQDVDYTTAQPSSSNILQKLAASYFFTVGPDAAIPFKALCGLAEELGWKQLGIIVANDHATNVDTSYVRIEHADLRFVIVQYVESDPYQTFEALFTNEIKILVYNGPANSFLNTLLAAIGHGFAENNNVWIFMYSNIAFPEEYVNLWCSYTPEEVYKLKQALRGSMMLGISDGTGQEREEYIHKFITEAIRITGSNIYAFHRHFIQTAYIHDSLAVVANALDALVKEKAHTQNISEDSVRLTMEDRDLLADQLRTLNYSVGLTGNISFTQFGRRSVSLVDLRNFVPIENAAFSVNTSLSEDPWRVQTRACLEVLQKTGHIYLVYFDENRTVSDIPTIIFPDGTTNPPPDRPFRIFVRSNMRVFLTTTISSLLFLLSVAIYATIIYYEDRKALLYNSNWIHQEEDIDFLSEEQGIKGRLTNVKTLRSDYGKNNLGRLKHGGTIVDVVKINHKRVTLTNKVYEEANLLMGLKHQNVCKFHGCLLSDSYTALLYEYCSRGSLESILLRSDIQFDWVFRLSFAMDAAQAMAFLHSKKIVHGALNTSNCMIDEKWTLKIQDFGLQQLRSTTQKQSQKSKKSLGKKIAPEIRFLGDMNSQAGDVYAYGNILEELSVIQCIPLDQADCRYIGLRVLNRPLRSSTQSRNRGHENDINPNFIKLQNRCHDNNPQLRPTFEEIKTELQQMSNNKFSIVNGQVKDHTGILQLYTRKLEEKVDWLSELLHQEEEHSNDFIQNYLPKKLASNMRKGNKVPLSQEKNKPIISLEMTNTELLLNHLKPEVAENVILTMQKAIEGVTCSFHVQKLYSTGTTWILATLSEIDTTSSPISEAVNAAIAILENFSGIFLPGQAAEIHPTIRLGLHIGDFVCGVVEDPVPQFVAYGNTIECSKQLMMASKDGSILASAAAAKELDKEQGFIVTFNKKIDFEDTTITTFWVEEDSNNQSDVLTPSVVSRTDDGVTIKSRMRKCTVQRFRPSPRSSQVSNLQRRKSSPPPFTKKQERPTTLSAIFGTRGNGSTRVSKLTGTGRSLSTTAELPDSNCALREDKNIFHQHYLPPV